MPFEIDKTYCTLEHINIRKDDIGPSLDLKFSGEISEAELMRLWPDNATGVVSMWDVNGDPALPAIDHIQLSLEFKHHTIELVDLKKKYENIKIAKVKISPVDDRKVKAIFTASIRPYPADIGLISEMLDQSIMIRSWCPQQDLDLSGDDSEKDKALDEALPEEVVDDLYDTAVKFVIESQRASISGIQRKLKIGYNRASRMIEKMESSGIIGPIGSDGKRTVIATKGEDQ